MDTQLPRRTTDGQTKLKPLTCEKVFNTAPSRTTPATSRAERAGTIPSKITTINSTRRRRVIRRDLSRIQRSAWSSNRPFVKVTLNFTLQKIDISRNLSQAVALQIRPTQRSYPSTENAIAVTTAVQQQRPEMQHKATWPYVSRLYLPPFLGTNSFGALCRKPKDKVYICRVFAHHMRGGGAQVYLACILHPLSRPRQGNRIETRLESTSKSGKITSSTNSVSGRTQMWCEFKNECLRPASGTFFRE